MRKKIQNPFSKRVDAFCAFCKSPRKIYRKKRIGFFDVMASLVGAYIMMELVFQETDARAILFFVLFLAIAEAFIQLRWRMAIVCQHCGFDPFLYLKKPEDAAAKVKLRLDQRREDPASLLSAPLNIPIRKVKKDSGPDQNAPAPRKGTRVSRQV